MTTAAAQPAEGLASAFFADDEAVYQSYPLLPGEDVPAFGCTGDWPANAVRRAAKREARPAQRQALRRRRPLEPAHT